MRLDKKRLQPKHVREIFLLSQKELFKSNAVWSPEAQRHVLPIHRTELFTGRPVVSALCKRTWPKLNAKALHDCWADSACTGNSMRAFTCEREGVTLPKEIPNVVVDVSCQTSGARYINPAPQHFPHQFSSLLTFRNSYATDRKSIMTISKDCDSHASPKPVDFQIMGDFGIFLKAK